MVKIQKYRRFFFGSDQALSSEQLDQFIDTFSQPNNDDVSVLGGREPIKRITLQDNTHAVIKHYLRGGIIHLFNKQYYLRTQGLRCRKEYELFRLVRNLGVNAPEPLVFVYSGLVFYRAWLITREIQGARSLAEISINDSERAKSVMAALINQVEILIDNNILHVDLHPGNVLVDDDDKIYIIDFDKAKTGIKNKDKLLNRYLRRWGRAVKKHRLPTWLHETMAEGL
jgi:3-deoxy-D-manno-octulosonic acid kinase